MNKKTGLIVGAVISMIVLIAGILIFMTGGFSPYERKIKMGYKLIGQERYEEAIIVFNDAIEIDNKKYKAYGGLAKTYITRCDENAINDAHQALSRGYEIYITQDIINQYLILADDLINEGKENLGIELLQKGYELSSDEAIKNKINEVILNNHLVLFEKLYSLFQNNDLDEIKTLMGSDEFINLNNFILEEMPVLYFPEGQDNSENHKGMGIYKILEEPVRLFIYYGNYIDSMRNGSGIWIGVDSDGQSYIFNGMWDNDLPNGYGEVIGTSISEDEDTQTITTEKYEMKGILTDGLWNGDIQRTWISDKVSSYTINYVNGIVTVLDGKNLVARNSNGDRLMMENVKAKHGIIGFKN